MRVLQHHVFDFHQTDLGRSLVLIQLHRNVFDVGLRLRDDDVFQSVYTTSGLFDLITHQLAGFLDLRQFQHIRQDICQRFDRIIQIAGRECKAIGIYIVGVRRLGTVGEIRNIYTHDVFLVRFEVDLLLWRQERCL